MPLVALCALGCGSGGSTADDPATTDSATPEPTPSSSTSATADGPACETVWQDGAKLPRSYDGCVDDAGALVPRDALGCSSGQRMVTYADRFYGVLGGTIHEAASSPLADDPDYRAAVRSCRA